MPDLTQYFDKPPTQAYSLGPSGLNIPQTGFSDMWRGWYSQGLGIFIVKSTDYNSQNPTGFRLSGSQFIPSASSMSFAINSGAKVYAATHTGNLTTVYQFSGTGYVANQFSGTYPTMFYNLSSNLPSGRHTHCFYLKNGSNAIFNRSTMDNFTTETIYTQNLSLLPYTLNQALVSPLYPRKISLLGLYSNGNGYHLLSDCFNQNNTLIASNWELYPSGAVVSLGDFQCQAVHSIMTGSTFAYDNYELYPSGSINLLNSGQKLIGYVWQ